MDIQLNSGTLKAECSVESEPQVCWVEGRGTRTLAASLESPLDLPRLNECSVPGDRITIAVDPATPELPLIISKVWEELHASGQSELNITILLPSCPQQADWKSITDELPVHITKQAVIRIHDPADESQRHYLASSAGGERIYLSGHIVDADLIVTIGCIAYDPLLGYRGTSSAIYPSLSDQPTIEGARGLGHSELTPDNKRPLRELVDEIGWLLGTQFSIQVIPDSAGRIGFAFSGMPGKVMDAGQACLNNHWRYSQGQPSDLVLGTIVPALPELAWRQFGAAVEAAGRITEDDGRIVIVADLPMPESPGLKLLQRSSEPADLLKPLNLEPTVDAGETIQLIRGLARYRIYLMSQLPDQEVEDLGMQAVSSNSELNRILSTARRCTVLNGADTFWTELLEQPS